ncbi:TonB-dependent receptor [uncultured Nitrospira sp.]|uniref:TonB-dependent siderophore receptor n=1 Tax=uncultured Nitrospira sp. TaxID=157176 RepID=UPI003140377E
MSISRVEAQRQKAREFRRKRLSGWLMGLTLVILQLLGNLTNSASAQESIRFDIPSQPLNTALTAFAEQSSWQLFYSTEIAEGLQNKALSGAHEPESALKHLLSGTGLEYRITGPQIVRISKGGNSAVLPAVPLADTSAQQPSEGVNVQASQPKTVKVPEIVVKDVRDRPYTTEDVSSATRIPVPVQETPRSVEVVTKEVIEDQKVIRMNDALRNASGTYQSSTQGGQGGTFTIRGFASDLNVFKNGFRDDSTFSSRAQRDIINIESIEVVKGPPSYLYGRSDPGGVINQITKAPLKSAYYSGEMIGGSYELYRPTVELGGPINQSKTLSYRFNGMFESAESYREGVKSKRAFLAPVFGWDIGPRSTFRLEGEYLYNKAPIDRGLVAIGDDVAPISIKSFLGDPKRKDETNSGKVTATFLHEFNDMFKWRTAFRGSWTKSRYDSLESWFLVGPESDGILDLARFKIPTNVSSNYMQNEVHGKFSTGSIKHKTLLGIELGREHSKAKVSSDFGGDTSTPGGFSYINIFNTSDKNFLDLPLLESSDTRQTNYVFGAYFGDQISLLDNLHVHGGGRFDIFEQKLTNRPSDFDPNTSKDKQTKNRFSPSVGITYQPWKPMAIYANYTESFVPQAVGSRGIDGKLFDPERGKAWEGGLKFQAFENKLRATMAVFQIDKTNVLTADPANGFAFSKATGKQRSRGFELDVAGTILPGWEIIANYAYTDTRVRKDVMFKEGSQVSNVPFNQGSIWTTYFFQEGVVKGFGAGIGMYAQGERKGVYECEDPANCQAPFEMKGFVRMDAALYYRQPNFSKGTNLLAAVNFTNLLDQRYMTGSQNFREIVYTGAPLTVIGSLKFEFF